jgi:ABC-2 type transport system permease protein
MFKLWVSIRKEWWLLSRDRVGLVLMFAMPILLVLVITSVQNSTFELVNDNKIKLMVCNQDEGPEGSEFISSLGQLGIFTITSAPPSLNETQMTTVMHDRNALITVLVPRAFSVDLESRASHITQNALRGLGLGQDSISAPVPPAATLRIYYHPVLQSSFRQSILGAVNNAAQLVQSKLVVRRLYLSLHEKSIPDSLEDEIVRNQIPIAQIPVSRNGGRNVPNASQHNVPAWTIFAMFFIVIPLGSSIVREKQNGSFLRLKTLPTSFLITLASKQITYLCLTLVQALVIFSIGVWIFPLLGLPALKIPTEWAGLLLVTLITGYCATSCAICIGVFTETQEQCNGIGSVSVVILAAIGGLIVPSFAMPASFALAMKISPLHWSLEAYYNLFLEGGRIKDIILNIIPLLTITLIALGAAVTGLRRKNLI